MVHNHLNPRFILREERPKFLAKFTDKKHVFYINTVKTRMHSSRMRTGRSLTVCWSLPLGGGGVCSQGEGGLLEGGGIPACTEADTPPVDRITDTSENITLATTSLRPVISHYRRILPVFFVLKKYEPISRVLSNHSAFNIKQIDLQAMKKVFCNISPNFEYNIKRPPFFVTF